MLHNRAMIVNNLSMLVKHKCMIGANLGGKDSLLTAIVAINHKDGTLILDYGSSDYLNKKLISTPHVKFTTGFNGIQVAFTSDKITQIKYQGEDAFIMPIPSSLYWYNRREYYRVNTPIMNPSICEITLKTPREDASEEYKQAYTTATDIIKNQLLAKIQAELIAEQQDFIKAYSKMSVENKIKAKLERQKIEAEREANPIVPEERLLNLIRLDLHDISLSGFSITSYCESFSTFLTQGMIYENCTLIMPEHGVVVISFEIMMKRKIETHKIGEFAELVGTKFINMRPSTESAILRYIQDVERQSGGLNA
ncbi:MAG: flagellar brake protein [Methylococcales bacterium]|nr:flagellar brake protein [Methylococcales bacterium]MDD5753336.1 flagellar brake protein [Methylococcales bacterium]